MWKPLDRVPKGGVAAGADATDDAAERLPRTNELAQPLGVDLLKT